MSHKAVNWALEQRHLKPGPWIVLIQLADRHNKDTGRVSPYQSTLAVDCNMPRSSVNNHLNALEEMGLIKRVRRMNPATKRKLGTHYILGFDFESPPKIDNAMSKIETRESGEQAENIDQSRVQNTDTEAMSKKDPVPCPNNCQSRVQNLDIIGTMEMNHGKEPCVADPPKGPDFDFSGFVDRFLSAHPRPHDRGSTENQLKAALDGGADPEHLIGAARAYAAEQSGNGRQYIARSDNWLKNGGWQNYKPQETPSNADVNAVRANLIKSGKPYLCRSISATCAKNLIGLKLVTEEECNRVEIRL